MHRNTTPGLFFSPARALVFLVLFGFIVAAAPHFVFAADYVPLAGIPGVPNTITNLPDYLNRLYLMLIGVGAIFAVVKIAYAGFQWAFSDIITDKSEAKKSIKGVLLGLAILLIPYIVLYTINSRLVNLDVIRPFSGTPPTQQPPAQNPIVMTCATRTFNPGETCISWCASIPGTYVTAPEPACQVPRP